MIHQFKLGKTSARKDAVKLKFKDYLDTSKASVLPTPPAQFGHEAIITDASGGWKVLGNDRYGDCVCAGAAHETMLWSALSLGKPADFSDKSVLQFYSNVTGFDPNDSNTDQGTDMEAAAKFRRKTGLIDDAGRVHKVDAYLALTPGDIKEHMLALYLFEAVGVGIEFPGSAMDQFNAGKPWDVVARSSIEGGHYIPLFAERSNLVVATWGRLQQMTSKFFKKYNDESIVYLSPEIFKAGKSPEGFNLAALKADLKQITA